MSGGEKRRAGAFHCASAPPDVLLERAKREILAAVADAGPLGSWGGDLVESILSATITHRVYDRARKALGVEGLVTMRGQRTTLTDAGRAHLAARFAARRAA